MLSKWFRLVKTNQTLKITPTNINLVTLSPESNLTSPQNRWFIDQFRSKLVRVVSFAIINNISFYNFCFNQHQFCLFQMEFIFFFFYISKENNKFSSELSSGKILKIEIFLIHLLPSSDLFKKFIETQLNNRAKRWQNS